MVEADKGVDFRKETREVFLKTLGEAAGDDDLLFLASGVFLTSIDGLDDSADGFILGDIDERAGVDDECQGQASCLRPANGRA